MYFRRVILIIQQNHLMKLDISNKRQAIIIITMTVHAFIILLFLLEYQINDFSWGEK